MLIRKISFLAAVMLLLPAASQAASLEDLLVEKGVITKSEARASMGGESSKLYWNAGTRAEFPAEGFSTQLNTILRTRYTYTDNDTGVDDTSSFDVNNARLKVSGTALNNEFSYALQTDFMDTGDSLLDAFIQWNACDNTSVRMGQYKVGVSRQYNTSVAHLQFPDRADVTGNFNLGRHRGARVIHSADDGNLVLVAGIYNGVSTGEGPRASGVDTDHTYEFAARWNAMGNMNPFHEGDVDMTDEAALNLGAAYAMTTAVGAMGDFDRGDLSLDANYKSNGLSVHLEYYMTDYEDDVAGGADWDQNGGYIQAGYMVDSNLEVAARYGYQDCDGGMAAGAGCTAGVTDKVTELDFSVNYYWWKHHLKAQLAYAGLNHDPIAAAGSDTDTNRWMLQLSSWF